MILFNLNIIIRSDYLTNREYLINYKYATCLICKDVIFFLQFISYRNVIIKHDIILLV